jgi:hypothetical protein
MKISQEFDYRNAMAVLEASHKGVVAEIRSILTDPQHQLDLVLKGKQRDLSAQVQQWFVDSGWEKEQPTFAIPDMRYDLLKGTIPIEIELGHQRLVFPDFFEFLADYSKGRIPGAVMVVTGDPDLFGHDWHCSLESTRRKIEAVQEVFLAPLLVIAVDP